MLRNIGSIWVLTVAQIGVTFLLMPFTIGVLGQDQYGAWVLIASLTGYLSMLTLGIPMATVRFVAKFSASEDQEALDRTVGSCAGLYVLMGVGALLIGGVLFVVFRTVYELPTGLRARGDLAFFLVVIYIAAGFLGQLPYGIMSAHHDFVTRNAIQLSGLLLRLGLTYGILSLNASLVWLAVIQLSTLALEFTIAMVVVRRRYPRIRIRFRGFSWVTVRELFSFSLFVLLLQVGTQLAYHTDALVIGAFLPIGEIPLFTVASSLALYVMEFGSAIGAVVMPMTSSLEAREQLDEVSDIFLKWSKIAFSLVLLVGSFLIVLGPRFIGWWIGPDFEIPSGRVLQILIVAIVVFLPARSIALPILMGLGRPGRPTIAFAAAAIANLVLSLALVKPLGLDGVALGTAIPNTLYGVFVVVLTCRTLRVRISDYARYVIVRPIVGVLPVLALLLWLRYGLNVSGFGQLFLSGIAMLAAFGLFWVTFVYHCDRYVELGPWIRRAVMGRSA